MKLLISAGVKVKFSGRRSFFFAEESAELHCSQIIIGANLAAAAPWKVYIPPYASLA